MLALGGRIPVGYYKDEAKSAATFRVIDGVRYSVPGDYAEIRDDGSIHLLGRGSVCINTGGEKVYPEEVEEASRRSPACVDAVVVGIPDERFGEEIVAVVQLAEDVPEGSVAPGHRHRPREGAAGRLQGAPPGPFRRHHRPLALGQGRLRPPPGRDGGVAGRGRLGRDQPLLAPCFRTKSLTV